MAKISPEAQNKYFSLGGGGGVPLSEQEDDPAGDFHSINVPGQQQATDSLALETGILG